MILFCTSKSFCLFRGTQKLLIKSRAIMATKIYRNKLNSIDINNKRVIAYFGATAFRFAHTQKQVRATNKNRYIKDTSCERKETALCRSLFSWPFNKGIPSNVSNKVTRRRCHPADSFIPCE